MAYQSQLTKQNGEYQGYRWKNVQKLLCYGHIKALPWLKADTIFHHVILRMWTVQGARQL